MAKYRYYGYYHGLDAVRMMNSHTATILKRMNDSKYSFTLATDGGADTEEYFTTNFKPRFSKDRKFLILIDVADKFKGVPVDTLTYKDATYEWIDIYKLEE